MLPRIQVDLRVRPLHRPRERLPQADLNNRLHLYSNRTRHICAHYVEGKAAAAEARDIADTDADRILIDKLCHGLIKLGGRWVTVLA